MNTINKIKKQFKNCPDLNIKTYNITDTRTIYIAFLETVTSNDSINEFLLKNLVNIINTTNDIGSLNNLIAASNTTTITNYEDIEFYITNGYAIVIDGETIIGLEARLNVFRSVSSPQVQTSINGPKDAFVESYLMNVGLIKRRIKSSKLKSKNLIIGEKSKTFVGILYIEDITDISLVNTIHEKLDQIDTDGIIDSSQIAHYLDGESRTIFPTIQYSERPDVTSKALLEGKIVIIVDNSTFALITPSFLVDFLHPTTDNYTKAINVNFIKVIRILAFFFTTMAPGMYISIVNYNQEAVPTNLLLNFATQREGLPFPAFIEAFIILFLSELLRESDLRFPSTYGSSISILGALVLGDAAVSAGIVSPIMIIVISLSFISGLMFTDIDMINATRYYKILFLVAAAFFGLYGWVLILFLLVIEITSTYTMQKPYSTPLAPFDKPYFKKTVFKSNDRNNKYRSKTLVKENIVRQTWKK